MVKKTKLIEIISFFSIVILLSSTSLYAAQNKKKLPAKTKTITQTSAQNNHTVPNNPKENSNNFEQIFSRWTEAFNQKDLEGSCGLFSKNIIAHYQGAGSKDYDSICNGFKDIFQKTGHSYQYRYKINQIYHSGNQAAINITWFLYEYEHDKQISILQEEGMDILEKNREGHWKIVNYLAYPIKAPEEVKLIEPEDAKHFE